MNVASGNALLIESKVKNHRLSLIVDDLLTIIECKLKDNAKLYKLITKIFAGFQDNKNHDSVKIGYTFQS